MSSLTLYGIFTEVAPTPVQSICCDVQVFVRLPVSMCHPSNINEINCCSLNL